MSLSILLVPKKGKICLVNKKLSFYLNNCLRGRFYPILNIRAEVENRTKPKSGPIYLGILPSHSFSRQNIIATKLQ